MTFISFLPGLLLMWFLYFIYCSGAKQNKIEHNSIENITVKKNESKLSIIVVICYIIFYPLYIKFYTGLSISSSLLNVLSGVSNYYFYQSHATDKALNIFTLTKLPYIIGHGLLRFMFIALVFRTIIFKLHVSLFEKLSIMIMSGIIIIVGLARGTSFELFELFLIFLFAIISKNALSGQKIISKKMILGLSTIIILLTSYFAYNVKTRMGVDFSFAQDTDFDKNSLLNLISPTTAILISSLYGYFLFGIYFSSIAITELWFSSINGFISIFIPNGIKVLGIDKGYSHFVEKFIEVGPRWNPDSIVFIESYGIILTIFIIYLLGRFSRKIYPKANNSLSVIILLFYASYFMLSLPIGNFIESSSANIISIFIAYVFYKFNFIYIYIFHD